MTLKTRTSSKLIKELKVYFKGLTDEEWAPTLDKMRNMALKVPPINRKLWIVDFTPDNLNSIEVLSVGNVDY